MHWLRAHGILLLIINSPVRFRYCEPYRNTMRQTYLFNHGLTQGEAMSNEQSLYRIQFMNNGKNYQLYVREIIQSTLFGFIEIADFVFDSQSTLLVDPSTEKLKTEFAGVNRSFIPMHAVIRVDAVTERGSARISDLGDNVSPFPYFPGKKP